MILAWRFSKGRNKKIQGVQEIAHLYNIMHKIELIDIDILTCKLTGEINLKSIITMINDVVVLEKKHNISKRLLDLTSAETIDLSYPDLLTFKQRRITQDPKGKTALVYSSSLALGFCRMWQEINELKNTEIQLFVNAEAARQWLLLDSNE